MSRPSLGTLTLNALSQNTRRAILFLQIDLDSGTERVHSWLGSISWGGNSWTGVGDLAELPELNENQDTKPDALRVALNGLTPDVVAMIDTQDIYRRGVTMYLGALDEDYQLVEDPGVIFSGIAEQARVTIGDPDGDMVMLEAESELYQLQRAKNVVYSNAQLQSEYSGDLGLQFIDQVADAKTVWRGRNPVRLGAGGSISGGQAGTARDILSRIRF